ncbi:MAG TPA: YebC/PmpR family DNA-binding transcriptional regulator [Patescibacteria group bacterium]|nr:YebC/PmpR family DNA-binding transcriptional regulator [Patescibacteria group bacterium]
MSGHSHYATIKRQKGANDAAKGNLFSKLARNIMLAAKAGADPDMNYKLRFEIEKAREASMPKENIERAIKNATTEAANITEVTYEGFGPGGVAVIVNAATDNKNRAAQEIKNVFERGGGSLAGPGAVSFNFEPKGFMLVKKSGNTDEQILKLIDAGVEDVEDTDDGIEVYVAPEKLGDMHKALTGAGFDVTLTELQMKPKNLVTITDPAGVTKVIALIDAIEDLDDVQKVFTNLDVPEDVAKNI